jgi:hypothetical protein
MSKTGQIYTILIALYLIFALYYQYLTTGFLINIQLLSWVSSFGLLFAGYSYFFKKKILDCKTWVWVYKGLIGLLVFGLIVQVWPTNYAGDFSFLNGFLLTNIFVYLLGSILFIPFYYAAYRLGYKNK